ncbi:MAG: adenylosuccinate synthase [Atopobiaceae bacterium]|nr:adenylosuccinate synthase [Atopobiaceae bacterium]
MPATVLVGTQWGDEGKGKITDLIAKDFDVVCRYQGGANAGHTVIANGHSLALHQIPSGVMVPGALNIIGNGCIVDPTVIVGEMDQLESEGLSCDMLRISGNAHVVMPYHKDLDGALEAALGDKSLGTTKRGIGPCYQDKFARTGIRIQSMLTDEDFRAAIDQALLTTNPVLQKIYGLPGYTTDQLLETLLPLAQRMRPHIAETSAMIADALAEGKNVLFEGAQATMLDIDFGTYPYVTSSNCSAGGAAIGSGVGPTNIDRVLGVVKAYTTRVGEGPFPTELPIGDEVGDALTEIGHEYGVTTGRRRRCGWYDAVITKYACRVNGLTHLAVTKLDVLGFLDTIKVCVAYEAGGKRYDVVPEHTQLFANAVPIYEELPGWKCDISGCTTYESLPKETKDYIAFIEELAGVPAAIVSVGPDREQTINRSW